MDVQEYLAKQRRTLPERRRKAFYWIAALHFVGTIIFCGMMSFNIGMALFLILTLPASVLLFIKLPGEQILWLVPVLIGASLFWGWVGSRFGIRS